MNIREIEEKDIDAASAVCLASFSASVAATLSEEGVLTFSNIAASDAFCSRMQQDNVMLVAECNDVIVGVVELKQGRHVAMLFVAPEKQMAGIGRKLLSAALRYAKVGTVTVSASLPSVPAYKKYGFVCKGDIAESAGLVYQPMQIELNQSIQ